MSRTKVLALPLHPPDTQEYLKIRRGVRLLNNGVAAYEVQKNSDSERLFEDVLGRSPKDLDVRIGDLLGILNTPSSLFETLMCDLIELDRAKHTGKVSALFPIGVNDAAIGKGLSGNRIRLTQKTDQLMAALENYASFPDVLKLVGDIALINFEGAEIRDSILRDNIEVAIRSSADRDMIIMADATHVPHLETLLDNDGISAVDVELPEKALGIWWLANTAAMEMRGSVREGDPEYGLETMKYALLLSLSSIRIAKGISGITEDEESAIRSVSSFDQANKLYHQIQSYYIFEFGTDLPILEQKAILLDPKVPFLDAKRDGTGNK